MNRQIVVDILLVIVGTVLGAFWCLSLSRQSLSQVSQVLEYEYGAAHPLARQILGPLPVPVEPRPIVDQHGLQASMGEVANLTVKLKAFMAVYPRLLAVRAFPYAAVYLMGFPLVLAAWQLGAARHRLRMQRGRAPNPWLHSRGGLLAGVVPILGLLIPGTLAAATGLSFAWMGVGGVVFSASGSYLIGMNARRG